MTTKRQRQEDEYHFPYHHIPGLSPFTPTRLLSWSHEYVSYLEKVLDTLATFEFSSLVDIGCGDGRLLHEARSRFDARMLGTDFSERALSFARSFTPSVQFVTKLPTDETFDAFTLIEVFEHIPPADADSFLANIRQNLAPGARGVITVPSTNLPLNPKHYRHFTDASLRAALEKHFTVDSVTYLNAATPLTKFIQRIISNRFFILNYPPLLQVLYRTYKKRYLDSDAAHGTRVMAVVTNPSS